jgi:hypothetical protein
VLVVSEAIPNRDTTLAWIVRGKEPVIVHLAGYLHSGGDLVSFVVHRGIDDAGTTKTVLL